MAKSGKGNGKGKRSKLRRWILAGSFLAGLWLAVWGYGYYPFVFGEGPAGPAVAKEPFDKIWTDRPVLLVGIGDSVTAGYGTTRGRSYFDRLAVNPPGDSADMAGRCLSRVMPNLQTLQLAVSGSNSIYHLETQLPKLPVQPKEVLGIVVLTTGGNDIIHEYGRSAPREGAMYGATLQQARPWIENFRTRLARMLDEIRAKFPGGCQIFIANIYDPTDGQGVPLLAPFPAWDDSLAILAEYNRIIAGAAASAGDVHLVDMRGGFWGHGFCCRRFWKSSYDSADPHFWYAMNIEDPNDRGYDALRRMFLLEMIRVLAPATTAAPASHPATGPAATAGSMAD